jgi:hypothetical protein
VFQDRQIAIHRTLDHPHIIPLFYYFAAPGRREGRSISWSLLMELMPATAAQEHTKFMRTDTIMPTLYIKVRVVDGAAQNVYILSTTFIMVYSFYRIKFRLVQRPMFCV